MRRYAQGEWPDHAAGGVTEEFTNLLSAVIGYAERVRGSVEPEHEVQPYLSGILGPAAHALSLAEPWAEGPSAIARAALPDEDAKALDDVLQHLQRESESLKNMVERMHTDFSHHEEPNEIEHTRGNILIIHSDRYIRRAYASTLATLGFCVWQEDSGWDAVQAVANASRRIDLLIAEADMPVLAGDDVAWILRSANPDTKVLLIAGDELTPLGRKMTRATANAYLKSAYSLKSLILTVEGLFLA
jgi:CheY-like chemotaxis protein